MAAGLRIDDPAYFDRLAEVEASHWWSRGLWRLATHWLDAALAGRRGLAALDVGCGAGLAAARLAARPEVDRVVALDPSPAALLLARRVGAADLVRADAGALPFDAGTFDLVTCLDVVQHLPDVPRAVAEIRRVLRPGGLALVRSNAASRTAYRGEGVASFDLPGLRLAFSDAGFAVPRATLANCLPALAEEARARLGRRLDPRPRRAANAEGSGGLCIRVPHPAVNRAMGCVATAEAFLAGRWGVPLPYGHSTMILARRGDPARDEPRLRANARREPVSA